MRETASLVAVALLLLSPSCGAAFVLPDPRSSSLVQTVTVTCEGGGGGGGGEGGCTPPAMNVTTCTTLNVCALSCPTRTGFPAMEIPLSSSTTTWTRPASNTTGCSLSSPEAPLQGAPSAADSSNGLLDVNSSSTDCAVSTSSATASSGRLALALWLWNNCTGNCTVARFGGSDVEVFVSGGKLCFNSVCGTEELSSWTHLVLQINDDTMTYAANGVLNPAGGPTIAVPGPSGPVEIALGLSAGDELQDGDSYQLYDVRYYSDVLTLREIQQLYTNGTFGDAGDLSDCRCPSSHLTLTPDDPYACQNETGSRVARVTMTFNPTDTLTDGEESSAWAGPDSGQFVLTVELLQAFQVESVEVALQATVAGDLTLNLTSAGQQQMTCSNLVCTADLKLGSQNVSPDQLADRVMQRFNLTYSDTSQQTPVVFSSIVVTGRCNCNGNAASCNISASPYICDCDSDTFTQGEQCQTCVSNRYRPTEQHFDCPATCDCQAAGVFDQQQMCDQDGGACRCKPNVQGQRCDACKEWTHTLTSSNPDGCHDCGCHRNGSVACSAQDGSCTCKTHVAPPLCVRCEQGYYDAGADIGPDDCQPCDCDPKGVVTGGVCQEGTGQCPCKEFVQGLMCDQCKDGYYNLQVTQSKGCLPCDCNSVGSGSDVCHKVTGQCPCQGDLTTGDRICSPTITSVEPRYGPKIGGTMVTIRGQLLGNSSQTPSVFLGSSRQNVQSNNLTTVVVETVSSLDLGDVPLTVSWQSEPSDLTSGHFTYLQDPRLDTASVTHVDMFVSGGCGVLFKGSNFRSVAVPRISVTDKSSGNKAYSRCRHVQQDLQCITPDLSGMPNVGGADLTFGLHLDGLERPDLGSVQVYPDPQLDSLGSHDFQYPFETTITISGSGLIGGCSQGEVSVLIGVVNCDIVGFSPTRIECEPPKILRGSTDKPIVVKMGSHLSQQVGTLNYLEFYETTYFIGIMCGVGALLLLVLVVVAVCCYRRRRRRGQRAVKRDSQHLQLMDKTLNGGGATAQPNQYSELPQAGLGFTNNGFQGPVQQETVIRERPKDAPVPSAADVDLMSEFLNRVEPSLWDSIRSAAVSLSDLTRGNICTNSGKFARIIDGHFNSVTGGQRQQIKVTIKTVKEKLPDQKGMFPMWATAALRECLRLHRHGGGNVLSMTGLALDRDRFHIVYAHMQNRTLKDHIIDGNKEFSVRQLVEYGLHVADGLAFLSSKDLVHRDLAARNCWVDSEHVVKISDAAFAWDFYGEEYVYDGARERHMPLRWMAPESLTDGYYDMRTDVWSLGVLLWELLTRGCLPFHEVEDERVKDYILEGYLLGKPENCSDNLYELMKECWNVENEHRPHITSMVRLLGEELSGDGLEQDDIYVNLGSTDGYYENQRDLAKARRQAPLPPPSYT